MRISRTVHLAALAAILSALGLATPTSAKAAQVQWRPVTDGLANPGGGVYLTNNHSGYYMGRVFKREMFGVHDFKGSKGFGTRTMDDGRVYRWGRAMGSLNECLWIGPAGSAAGSGEYLGEVDGRNDPSCSRKPMRALADRDNFGKDFNCPANEAVGPQRTRLRKEAGFYYNVNWVRDGDRYSVAHVAGRRHAVLPEGSTVWYRYTTRDGRMAVVFAVDPSGNQLGWGFVDADMVEQPDMQHWTLAGSWSQEWTCGTALDAEGRHWQDTFGVVRGSTASLSDDNATVAHTQSLFDPLARGGRPVAGDWDGDGRDEIGLYDAPYFHLFASNAPDAAVRTVVFGSVGDLPVAGDWDGDGIDTPGVFRAGEFLLTDDVAPPAGQSHLAATTRTLMLGGAGDIPLAGRWHGTQRVDSPAIYRAPEFYFALPVAESVSGYLQAAGVVRFGGVGDEPVAGDWDNKGHDSIGVFRSGTFMLRNANSSGSPDSVLAYGSPGDLPVVGNWDGR